MTSLQREMLKFRYVDKHTGCWMWTKKQRRVYGSFKGEGVARIAYRLWKGRDPKHQVCHTCDRPRCFRPKHLFDGTQAENIRDAVQKNRMVRGDRHHFRLHPWLIPRGKRHGLVLHPERRARGERHGQAKLTEYDVHLIRRLYASGVIYRQIAFAFKISVSNVHEVVIRRHWAHVA